MSEDAAIPEGSKRAREQDEVPDEIHVDESHGHPCGQAERRGAPLRLYRSELPLQRDGDRGAAVQPARLLTRVVVLGPFLAVADGAEPARADAAAHEGGAGPRAGGGARSPRWIVSVR